MPLVNFKISHRFCIYHTIHDDSAFYTILVGSISRLILDLGKVSDFIGFRRSERIQSRGMESAPKGGFFSYE